jgi:hypothetical protein
LSHSASPVIPDILLGESLILGLGVTKEQMLGKRTDLAQKALQMQM